MVLGEIRNGLGVFVRRGTWRFRVVLVEQEAKSWYLGRRGTWRIIMVLGKILGEKLEGPGTVFGVSSLLIQNKRETKGPWWAVARQGGARAAKEMGTTKPGTYGTLLKH